MEKEMQVCVVSVCFLSRTDKPDFDCSRAQKESGGTQETAARMNLRILQSSPHCNLKTNATEKFSSFQRAAGAPEAHQRVTLKDTHIWDISIYICTYTYICICVYLIWLLSCKILTAITTYLMMEVISLSWILANIFLAISRNTWVWNTMKYTDEFSLHSCISAASKNSLALQYCFVIHIGGRFMLLNVF